MDWTTELTRCALHVAAAGVVLWIALRPARPWIDRLVAGIAAMRPGTVLALVLGLTLATRLALMPAVHPVYEADIKEYCEKAAAIARDGHPRNVETRADGTRFYRTLGYSLPLAGWYRATGMPETPEGRTRAAQWFNVLCACGVAALLLALGRTLGRETAGRVAALAYATFLPAVMFCLLPYTETWATLLVVGSALAFEELRRSDGSHGYGTSALFGLLQGLLLITRTEFLAMSLVAWAWLLLQRLLGTKTSIRLILLFFAIPLFVNHQMRDGYPGALRTSVQGGLILYFGNNPIEVNGYGNATPAVAAHVQALYAKDPTGGLAKDEALAWMREHPIQAVANAPKKLYHLWLAEPQGFTWHVAAGRDPGTDRWLAGSLRHLAWVQALCLLALGMAGLLRRDLGFRFWLTIVVLHAATWCLLASSTRNRYPLEPLLMVAAAVWMEARRRRDP